MNRKQREQNKGNAYYLADNAVICPECGERGKHYIVDPAPWFGGDCGGFWTCKKFYGPDGRRLTNNVINLQAAGIEPPSSY